MRTSSSAGVIKPEKVSRAWASRSAGKAVVAPGLAQSRRGAGDVAAREQRPRQREMPFGGVRRLGPEEIDDGLRIDAVAATSPLRPAAASSSMPGQLGLAVMNAA